MKKYYLIFTLLLCIAATTFQAQTYTVLHNFSAITGFSPLRNLTALGKHLYGTTQFGGTHNNAGCIFTIDTDGNGYRVLHNFDFSGNGAGYPNGSVIFSGTTMYGLADAGGVNGYGSIFSMDTDGTNYTVMHDFGGSNDGRDPRESLTLVGNTLYGATEQGGTNNSGTVFSINTNGTGYRVLLSFSTLVNGATPISDLTLQGKHLFGVANQGGSLSNLYGCLYRIDTNGANDTVLFNFSNATGYYPWSSPLISGNTIYGTTQQGGANSDGVIYSIKTDGTGYTILYDGTYNGGSKFEGDLILNGNTLCGLAPLGLNDGTFFSVNTDGSSFTRVLAFTGNTGAFPGNYAYGGLTQIGSTYYGMTSAGGANDSGVIFKYLGTITGVNEIGAKSNSASLYPNPNHGKFTIQSSGLNGHASLEIYNTLGEKVLTQTIQNIQDNNTIDIGLQSNGVYFYRIISGTGTLAGEGKVIIEK